MAKNALDAPELLYQRIMMAANRLGDELRARSNGRARRAIGAAVLMVPLGVVLSACAGGRRAVPELATLAPAARAAAFDHVAEVAGHAGDGAVAERLYRRAMADRPDWVEPQIGLGRLFLRRGELDSARAQFDKALRLAPEDGRPVAGLAGVTLAEHHPEAALEGYAQALRLAPGDGAALNGSGVALDQLGRHGEAQSRYRAVLAVNPEDRIARNNLAVSLALDGRAAEAVPLLSALAEGPDAVARNRQNLALALALLGRDTEAVAAASMDEAPAAARADVALLDVLRRGVQPGASLSAEPGPASAAGSPVPLAAAPPS